jgi:hypothetical protein
LFSFLDAFTQPYHIAGLPRTQILTHNSWKYGFITCHISSGPGALSWLLSNIASTSCIVSSGHFGFLPASLRVCVTSLDFGGARNKVSMKTSAFSVAVVTSSSPTTSPGILRANSFVLAYLVTSYTSLGLSSNFFQCSRFCQSIASWKVLLAEFASFLAIFVSSPLLLRVVKIFLLVLYFLPNSVSSVVQHLLLCGDLPRSSNLLLDYVAYHRCGLLNLSIQLLLAK